MSQNLPPKWHFESLGKCCTIVSGATPRRNVPEYWGNHIPWVTPKDISHLDSPVLEDTPEYISKAGYKSCSANLLPEGSVLFSSRAPIGLVALTGREMCTNQGFKSLIPGEKVHSEYLYHCMKWMAPKIAELGNGATFKEVSKEVVSRVKIPLPPLAEQKRIASILDKADAIHRKRLQATKLADDFFRATFLDMFGDIPAKKSKYDFKPVRPFCSARSGKSSKKVITNKKTDYPIYGGNGVNGWATAPLYHEPVIVLGRVGQQCGIVHQTSGPAWVTDNAIVLEITNKKKLHPIYLTAALKNSLLRTTVERLDLPFINQSIIMDYPLPLPPIAKQIEYVKIVDKFRMLQLKHNKLIESSKTMFSSLTQRAFRGEL
jgi:type I restriction enzyme S subunit